jgi:hypothetical protein
MFNYKEQRFHKGSVFFLFSPSVKSISNKKGSSTIEEPLNIRVDKLQPQPLFTCCQLLWCCVCHIGNFIINVIVTF